MKSLNTLVMTIGILSSLGAVPPFVGDWSGSWVDPKPDFQQHNPQIHAQVIALGNDRYRVVFLEELQRRARAVFEGTGTLEAGAVAISGDNFSCTISDTAITGKGVYKSKEAVSFELSRVDQVSPTMGRPAPEGAVVLFDGTSLEAWKHVYTDRETGEMTDGEPTWRIVDGVMEVVPRERGRETGGDLYTRRKFGSCEMHIEFWLPYEPDNRGQGRANSGVFLQGIYEVQILDSYGLEGLWDECGALYKVAPPKVNRCAPPGQWQTFDITFHAPEYDADGKLVKNAVMSVLHNGLLIHNGQELFEVTYYHRDVRLQPPPSQPEPIFLQDHNHPVRFRNIWVRPLD